MSRSPLAYPLARGIDGDVGGAADLQTDIMRFMAILALCLVAIFALVQSIPLAPQPPATPTAAGPASAPPEPTAAEPPPFATTPQPPPAEPPVAARLTRAAKIPAVTRTADAPALTQAPAAAPERTAAPQPTPPDETGFTLRFASDLALTRLVASGQVGFYAIDSGRARRMSVSESRISFWDASTPNAIHQMEASTVPRPVVDALSRTGADATNVDWGVTLPGRLQGKLWALMSEHAGGTLIIGVDGSLTREAS